jgi:hypothetical protein
VLILQWTFLGAGMRHSESLIEVISRSIMEGDIRVSKQIRLIERLQLRGLDTAEAERFLYLFQCDLDRRYDLFHKLIK